VVLTPHVAAGTYETSLRRGAAAAENVKRVARGDEPLYVVT
jgi:phosphoglycerate dehydrogenase-like enzyme